MSIKNLEATTILDSKGNETIELELETDKGLFKSSVPSGTSAGSYEVKKVDAKEGVENINKKIKKDILGWDVDQKKIDDYLISKKEKLGGNTTLAVSIAVCRAGAYNKPLYKYINELSGEKLNIPRPAFLMVEGGRHGDGLDIQEFILIPNEENFEKNLEKGKMIYDKLGYSEVGLEGGYINVFNGTEKALDKLSEFNEDIYLDCAASEFYENDRYYIDGEEMTYKELLAFYKKLVKKYPITMIEDPFDEEAFSDWKKLNKKIILVGDDLTVTNTKRMETAKKNKSCSSMILKPNQIGTVTESIEAAKLAHKYKWSVVVSHRSGETMDAFISDLAVGVGAEFIKTGAPMPPERMVKYNRLLEIEREI